MAKKPIKGSAAGAESVEEKALHDFLTDARYVAVGLKMYGDTFDRTVKDLGRGLAIALEMWVDRAELEAAHRFKRRGKKNRAIKVYLEDFGPESVSCTEPGVNV